MCVALLRENGVSYNVHGETKSKIRPWQLDPIPLLIDSTEWASIESGLIQRAELFNLILTDLYGPRELVKNKLIPPELIYSLGGLLRPCDQIKLPGDHQLILYAADLARGPDNRLWVISDRSQAPLGLGYALENRIIMFRVFPSLFRDCQVHRLAVFYRALRTCLEEVSPHGKNIPLIVVLTAGPQDPTYFEHAYLTSYLGYTLVRGSDLTVRNSAVWLKSVEGLKPVDIILRRIEDRGSDPLELHGDYTEGIPGLLEAIRHGNVTLVNPIGSSALENPGILPFLPAIAQHLLGQELRLPSAATWWCGQEKEKGFVLENLNRLVIKQVNPKDNQSTVYGGSLSSQDLQALKQKIQEKPYLYVGQERVSFSTTPSLAEKSLQPRHAILRTFTVARGNGYVVMPGGLTLSAALPETFIGSYESGVVSKDTWILASEPERQMSFAMDTGSDARMSGVSGVLTSRSAENLFWVGRYAERTEYTARMLRTVINRYNEEHKLSEKAGVQLLRMLLRALTRLTGSLPGFIGQGSERRFRAPEQEIMEITRDPNRNGSLAMTLLFMINAAYSVRERWSVDTWRVMNDIEDDWMNLENGSPTSLERIQNELDQLITTLVAFSGLNIESMTRETGWKFLDIGRRLERAICLIKLMRSIVIIGQTELVEYQLLESLLATTETLITYRRRHRTYLQRIPVLELLLLDHSNPRALVYQLDQLQTHIGSISHANKNFKLTKA